MKKRIFSAFLAMLMVFTLIAPTAAAATPEKVYITIEANGSRYAQHAYKSGNALLVPVTMLTQFGGMRYSVSGSNYTFYYQAETSGGRPLNGARRIFLNVGKKTVQTVYYPTSGKSVTISSASLSSTYTANKEHYIPLEELLPLLDAKVEIGKDGIVHIQSNPMPLFRALHYARPDLFPFGMDEYLLGDVVSATGLIVETIMGRYDRLDIINGSGAVKDYSSLFKKFLTINETYMAAFDKTETPIDKGIKEVTGAAGALKSPLSGTKDVITMAEYIFDSSLHTTYKEFAGEAKQYKNDVKTINGIITVIKFADTYINQVEDHRNMLNAVYSGGSAPAARAANEIYSRYGKDTAAQLHSVGMAALRDYVTGEVAGIVNKGANLKPYTIAFSAVKTLLPDAMKTFSESAELFFLDRVAEDAKAAAEKGLSSHKVDKASLEKLRLSLIMYLVSVKYGYDTYGEIVDSSSIDKWLEMLYLAADSVECVSSGYYANKKAELKKSVSSVKTTGGSDGKTTKKTTTKATKNTTTKATKKTTATTTTKANGPVTVLGSGSCGENVTWKLTSDGVLTISGTGAMEDFEWDPTGESNSTAPWEKLIWDHLRSIGYGSGIKLIIENGVTTVGDCAFMALDIAEVNIPVSVAKIGVEAFWNSTFKTFHIPANVKQIGGGAFSSCNELIQFTVDTKNTAYTAVDGVLYTKDMKTMICYPISKPGNAFTIPKGVETTIVSCEKGGREWLCSAFEGAALTSIHIPASLIDIELASMNYKSCLATVTVDKKNPKYATKDGVLFQNVYEDKEKKLDMLCLYPPNKKGASYTIPDEARIIGWNAFMDCENLTNLTIPDSVEAIYAWAILDCDKLTTIHYQGTKAQWNAIEKAEEAFLNTQKVITITVICTDGELTLTTSSTFQGFPIFSDHT